MSLKNEKLTFQKLTSGFILLLLSSSDSVFNDVQWWSDNDFSLFSLVFDHLNDKIIILCPPENNKNPLKHLFKPFPSFQFSFDV